MSSGRKGGPPSDNSMNMLVNRFISKASATQRSGRTGRIAPGSLIYIIIISELFNDDLSIIATAMIMLGAKETHKYIMEHYEEGRPRDLATQRLVQIGKLSESDRNKVKFMEKLETEEGFEQLIRFAEEQGF